MKRKPLEKLSDRLNRLFLTHVKEYDVRYFRHVIAAPPVEEWNPAHFAKKMTKYCMDMIAEYEPEDIE